MEVTVELGPEIERGMFPCPAAEEGREHREEETKAAWASKKQCLGSGMLEPQVQSRLHQVLTQTLSLIHLKDTT